MTYNLDIMMGGVEPCLIDGVKLAMLRTLMMLGVEPFWDWPAPLRWLIAFRAERWSGGVL